MIYRIGTRTSKLALAQTEEVIAEVKKIYPQFSYEIIRINTKGDQVHHKPLREIFEDGKNAFTSELQKALKDNKIDIAVHSMKDVAGNVKEENLTFPAFLERRSANDVLISRNFVGDINSLPENFIIGTVSLRRKSALLKLNSKIKVRNLRGSVQTRIAKLRHEFKWDDHPPIPYDGIIMAKAAIERSGNELDLRGLYSLDIPVDKMIPAACQGIIGVECRKDDNETIRLFKKINHAETETAASIEREFLYLLGGNCHTSIGVYCCKVISGFEIIAEMSDEKGANIITKKANCKKEDTEKLASKIYNMVISEAEKRFGKNYKEIFNIS